MFMLQTEDVLISLGGKTILRDVNIALLAGKRTAIIGPNGSGKSTLLKALAGLIHPASGKVLFENEDIRACRRQKLAQRLAILPQGSGAPGDLTVAELVAYGRFPHRRWWKSDYAQDKKAIERSLTQTAMQPLRERLVSTLSGGERQRAWIAMALAQEPKVLLLDEPTTYLDIAHQLEVMNIITQLNRKNQISIVMVLHDLNHARQYADEIIVVDHGRIIAQGAPEDVLTVKLLSEVFRVSGEFFVSEAGERILVPMRLCEEKDAFDG